MIKKQYIIYNGTILRVAVIDEYIFPIDTYFHKSQFTIYDDKKDALYVNLLHELSNGKSLDNYKRSKYFKYYIERLKKENPEFII